MAKDFTTLQWQKITDKLESSAKDFGLPDRRENSVVLGTFNIRKLGGKEKRSDQSWHFLKTTLKQFDLIAIQEVMDDIEGLEHLKNLLADDYGLVVSDVTGVKPGAQGNAERLAFIFNWTRIKRTALASDITYDRTVIANNLFEHRAQFTTAQEEHISKLAKWEEKVKAKKKAGKRAPSKPTIELPRFVTFIRQPHYVSFKIEGKGNAAPYQFLVVNAHLLYGNNKKEREWEFMALIEWLTVRAKQADRLYHPNLLLLGDCNLDFDSSITTMRDQTDAFIKSLNKSFLKSKSAATANFPLLTPHPTEGILRTALRQEQTYDQIGFFNRDERLPAPDSNSHAGTGADNYNYGVFNIADLIAQALHNKNIADVTQAQQKSIYAKAEYSISDHMPAWVRLPLPS